MRETNPPSNPELLDALAQRFVKNGYDLKALIKRHHAIAHLPTQRRCQNNYNKADRQNFSRYYAKRLSAEVLFDAVNQAHAHARATSPDCRTGTLARFHCPTTASTRAPISSLSLAGRTRRARANASARTEGQPRAGAPSAECQRHPGESSLSDSGAAAPTRRRQAQLMTKNCASFTSSPTPANPTRTNSPSPRAHLEKPRKAADGKPLDCRAKQAPGLRGRPLGHAQHQGVSL